MIIQPELQTRKFLVIISTALISIFTLTACLSVIGAPGIGDPLNPELGNGGYDIDHYDIKMKVDPLANSILAEVRINATTIQNLRGFNLDFAEFEIDSLQVNGSPASYVQQGNELIVTPSKPIPNGQLFTVYLEYHGNPEPLISPILDEPAGWFHFEDGTINIINWPDGTGSWLPGNHHPIDKATFRFDITVPEPWIVVAPGKHSSTRQAEGETQFIFDMELPMSSVSAVLYIDDYQISETTTLTGLLIRSYVPGDASQQVAISSDDLAPIIEYLSSIFGEYPFGQYNMVLLDPGVPFCLPFFGGANAEQTVSAHCPEKFSTGNNILVHEITHQWFGLSVGPVSFQDSWLVESPATYAEWLWQTHEGSVIQIEGLARGAESSYYAASPIGSPSADTLLSDPIYWGGALLLHALRQEVGDEVFFEILQTYLSRNQYSSASTADFRDIAEEISGRDLNLFFDSWLLEDQIPTLLP